MGTGHLKSCRPVPTRRERAIRVGRARALFAVCGQIHQMRTSDDRSVAARSTLVDALGARAGGASIVGAAAVGATAIGALAVGAAAVGRLIVGRAVVRQLEAGEVRIRSLSVEELRIAGQPWRPSGDTAGM